MAKAKRAKRAKKKPNEKEPRPAVLVSPDAYGASRGCSRQAVMRAISYGRLEGSVSKNARGWWRIDARKADLEWAGNTDPRKQRDEKGGPTPIENPTPRLPGMPMDPERTAARLSHAQASADRVSVQAQLAHLTLREKLGELVDGHDVRQEYFQLARRVRDRLMGIPDRIAAVLAAEQDTRRVHRQLVDALVDALLELVSEEGEPG